MKKRSKMLPIFVFACLFLFGMHGMASGQGRGGGRGQGGPPAGSPGRGEPAGIGVDRGSTPSSVMPNGPSDTGGGTASNSPAGRYDAGLERARLQRENA